jgi:hypothetical protein
MNNINFSLIDLLESCINKDVVRFEINKHKLFPYDNGNMKFIKNSTHGFYNIITNNTSIFTIALKDNCGSHIDYDFIVEFKNNSIRSIEFDKIKIWFKI